MGFGRSFCNTQTNKKKKMAQPLILDMKEFLFIIY